MIFSAIRTFLITFLKVAAFSFIVWNWDRIIPNPLYSRYSIYPRPEKSPEETLHDAKELVLRVVSQKGQTISITANISTHNLLGQVSTNRLLYNSRPRQNDGKHYTAIRTRTQAVERNPYKAQPPATTDFPTQICGTDPSSNTSSTATMFTTCQEMPTHRGTMYILRKGI